MILRFTALDRHHQRENPKTEYRVQLAGVNDDDDDNNNNNNNNNHTILHGMKNIKVTGELQKNKLIFYNNNNNNNNNNNRYSFD